MKTPTRSIASLAALLAAASAQPEGVTGLVPGQSVRLIWGTQEGAQRIRPGCEGGTLLIRDPRTSFDPVLADGDGVARFYVQIPKQASGMTVRYQAVCIETCEISHTVT